MKRVDERIMEHAKSRAKKRMERKRIGKIFEGVNVIIKLENQSVVREWVI